MKKHFLFDMDGVLVDTEHLHEGALQLAASEFGFHVDPSGAATSLAKLRRAGVPEEYHQNIYVRKKEMFEAFIEQIKPDPVLKLLLERIVEGKGTICVCSNCNTDSCRKVLTKLGIIGLVKLIVTSSDVEKGKPFPDIYKLALRKLHVEPLSVVVFEDSPEGVASAIGAGIEDVVCCTTTTFNREVSKWL